MSEIWLDSPDDINYDDIETWEVVPMRPLTEEEERIEQEWDWD